MLLLVVMVHPAEELVVLEVMVMFTLVVAAVASRPVMTGIIMICAM